MSPETIRLAVLVAAAVIGLAAVITTIRLVRLAMAKDAKVTLIGAAIVALAAGTLTISFVSLWHLTGTPWLGLFIDAAVVVLMALQLVGVRGFGLALSQTVILCVSMWANAQAHEPPPGATQAVVLAVAALGACQPMILKVVLVGFKRLIAKYIHKEDLDDDARRVPGRHWLHDPRGAYWITRQLALRTIPTYDAACRINTNVTRETLRRRAESSAGAGQWWTPWTWNRTLSPRQVALLDVMDEEAARVEPRRRQPASKPTPARSADAGAGATATARPAPAPSPTPDPEPSPSLVEREDWDEMLAAARTIQNAADRRLGRDAMYEALKARKDDDGEPRFKLGKPKAQKIVEALDAERHAEDAAAHHRILQIVGEAEGAR